MMLATVNAVEELDEYPLRAEDRLDSHHFVMWEHRRWLNCDMRMKGTPECRALYLDLIWHSYGQSPIGTLPTDTETLAYLAKTDEAHFKRLCEGQYGPLHNWVPCQCGSEVRLMHPFVLDMITQAIAGKEHNRARNEAANAAKRQQRLRARVAGLHVDVAKNDAAISFMDEWLVAQNVQYRTSEMIEKAMMAWSQHMHELNTGRARTMG